MKAIKDEIEQPVKKSGLLLVGGVLVLLFMLGIGVFLLEEALQEPKSPEDALNMKRMLVSGVGLVLFSLAVVVFLLGVYQGGKKQKSRRTVDKRLSEKKRKTKKRK